MSDDERLGTPKPGPQDPTRHQAVDRARQGWIRRLIDLSRRNNLLYYRNLKAGTLDLSSADTQAVGPLLRGETVPLSRLVPESELVAASARAQETRRRAVANLEERGLDTLFLAIGMATWQPADDGRPTEAAILLMPLEIGQRGRESRAITLRRKGEVQVNLSLLHVLESEYGVSVSPESLLELLDGDDEGEPFDPGPVYGKLEADAKGVPAFSVKPRLVVGNFAFQKTAMVRDLINFGPEMAEHDLIAAMAGDAAAREAVLGSRVDVSPEEIDRKEPEAEFLVLDADASQQRVILEACRGQDGVVQGPPGTGKSQTIANLITESAAAGRRILFVAEKRAALEVVQERLKQVGLTHLALDLHGADLTRKDVAAKISTSLSTVREAAQVDVAAMHRRFVERRKRLNDHVARMHTAYGHAGLSVYELQGRLLRIPTAAEAHTRWRDRDLERLDARAVEALGDLFGELRGFSDLFQRANGSSPWAGAALRTGRDAQEAIDLVGRLIPAWNECLAFKTEAAEQAGVVAPASFKGLLELSSLLEEVATNLQSFPEEVYAADLPRLAADLNPALSGLLKRGWAFATSARYRRALRALGALRKQPVPASKLKQEADAMLSQLSRWQTIAAGAKPRAVAAGARLHSCLARLRPNLERLQTLLGDRPLDALDQGGVGTLLLALAKDATGARRVPRLTEIDSEISALGAGALLEELREGGQAPNLWPDAFQFAWLTSWLDQARAADPALGGFDGRTHDSIVREFRELDRERIRLTALRVRRTHAEAVIAVMNAKPEQAALVRAEAAKKSRHLPIRKLLSQAPDVLTTLLPCWMASPLSVSHLLPADRGLFDTVLFDEASQVLPEDAVPALLRGKHAVVAGDRMQLPPTTFFLVGDDDDAESEAPAPTEGFESILDLLSGFLEPWTLDWHYRSRDEALIAFSNHHIYGGRLVTFPSPQMESVVQHVLVDSASDQDGQEESASAEVREVVRLVLEHAEKRPMETLGVIALGIAHARRIEAAVDEALHGRPDLDAFFDQSRAERFFVKNLERVQGDERDAIILSVGYGKDRTGRVLYRFGPLLQDGGERRLNVAITRARSRMTVVSSFGHHDMDPSRSKARGVELLRLYLEYAASGGRHLGQVAGAAVLMDSFEQDVYDALVARGVGLLPQWGASRYRLDFAVKHPKDPGRLVLAIECDGATYHSANSARDRDRLRQQHLEALGWRFHRIWSTDWFLRRDAEIERTLAAIGVAVERSDREERDAGTSQPAAGLRGAVDPPRPLAEVRQRGPRPALPDRDTITSYKQDELVALIAWIQSDGILRTDEEILSGAIEELGFERRGSRIESAIRAAIEAWRKWDENRRKWGKT